jgi:hypothetical protein
MGLEPNARTRLKLVCRSTKDPILRQELAFALEDYAMSLVPSLDLSREIEECPDCSTSMNDGLVPGREGLCESHRGRWNLEACLARPETEDMADAYLDRLLLRAMGSGTTGAELLSAFECQARALEMVWEAHRLGAAQLPPRVAASLERARTAMPGFLQGGGSGATHTTQRRSRSEERVEMR